ncbi:MAG TPA: hypothetical protein VGO07_05220 [Candidatus Saccharimonadales bacterium]|jgi:hypothetical protein|nr:hypothetical protein [Candidatus Saccharimonadales bacterium]
MSQIEVVTSKLEVVHNPAVIAHLTIGGSNVNGDKIGPGYEFTNDEQAASMARAAGEATHPYTVPKAAYCIDERPFVKIGNVEDPAALREVVTPQLPGGTNLAATKAAVAANATIVREARDFNEAYDIVSGVLSRAGYQDAGHEDCGASKKAELSVADQVLADVAFGTLQAAGVARSDEQGIFADMQATKQRRVDSGFYSVWDPAQHKARILATAPQHYSYLQAEHDATHGHHAGGLYTPTQDGMGFAKNEFTDATGAQLFGYTPGFAAELANELGGTDAERRTIELAFGYDLVDVSNQLIAKPEGDYPGLTVIQ